MSNVFSTGIGDNMKIAYLIDASREIDEQHVADACDLANSLSATVCGVAFSEESVEHLPAVDGYFVDDDSAIGRRIEELFDVASRAFKTSFERYDVPTQWVETRGYLNTFWSEYSPYFDFAITTEGYGAPAIANAGITPAVQLSPNRSSQIMNGHGLIAWNGSLQSGRAVRASLPILKKLASVEVLTINPNSEHILFDIGDYLASHQISAKVTSLISSESEISNMIINQTQETDLLVMGAYGVSMMLEKWFGGVTEDVSKRCQSHVIFAK